MNTLAYPKLFESSIDYEDDTILNLVIENKKAFRELLYDINQQTNGFDGDVVFSSDLNVIPFKNICFISEYIEFNFNSKEIIQNLTNNIIRYFDEETYVNSLSEVNSIIQRSLFDISLDLPCEVSYNNEIDIKGLIKLYNPTFITDDLDLKNGLISYMSILRDLCKTNLFILCNIKCYFSKEEIEELHKCFKYEKFNVIEINSEEFYILDDEKTVIVDDDLCVIF